jgi:hypothetical protein
LTRLIDQFLLSKAFIQHFFKNHIIALSFVRCNAVCYEKYGRRAQRKNIFLSFHLQVDYEQICQHLDYTAIYDTMIMNVEQLVEWKVARETKVLRENLSHFNIKKDDVIIKECQIHFYPLPCFPRM